MAKRIIVILFLTLAYGLWRGAEWMTEVGAQKRTAVRRPNYSKFMHSSHDGKVKSLTLKNQSFDIDCAYCHGTATKDKLGKDQHYIEVLGYPSHKDGVQSGMVHSACTECHAFTGSAIERDMCLICHDKLTLDPKLMKTNILRFPNPSGGGVSQFYDDYSHSNHVGYFDQFITRTTVKDRIKFYDKKKDAKANKGLDKDMFECAACHTNQTPVTTAKMDFNLGVKMTSPGHSECFICHLDPKIVTPPKKDKPDPKNTFATNCRGCHLPDGKPMKEGGRPARGSELAMLWFAREIVDTEFNPIKPGVKPALPYNHKTHDDAVGKAVKDCLSCHATGKTANTRSDFYLEDRKTKEKQPLIWSCVECHDKDGMQVKIQGSVVLENSKCNYCHAYKTIREYEAKGIQLPPPNHFYKKPKPTPDTLAMAKQPDGTAQPAPPTPAPAPTPAPESTPKPDEVIAANRTKPEPEPAPPVAASKPAEEAAPTSPTPAPAPTPAPNPPAETAATPEPTSAPTPTPAPAEAATPPKPTPAPEPTPTPEAAPKPEPTPTPEAAEAAPKPEPTPAPEAAEAAPKPEPTPAPEAAPKPEAPPADIAKAEPPKKDPEPSPAPTPAPAAPDAGGAAAAAAPATPKAGAKPLSPLVLEMKAKYTVPTGKPQTQPKIPRLGDPKDNPYWGKSDKWGVVENFDHEAHTTPKYSKSCEECHHTNIDSLKEMAVGGVPLCTKCHQDDGSAVNPKNAAGDEINVEIAYHGNPDNTTNNAGCIECHKRYYEANPDAEQKAPTSKCAGCHAELSAQLDWRRIPGWRNGRSTEILISMIRALKPGKPAQPGKQPAPPHNGQVPAEALISMIRTVKK